MSGGDDFTIRKLAWLEQLACDSALSSTARSLAILVAVRFLNRERGVAFPSQKLLSEALHVSPNSISKAVCQLSELGYLAVDGRRGPGGVNLYRIASPGHQPTLVTDGSGDHQPTLATEDDCSVDPTKPGWCASPTYVGVHSPTQVGEEPYELNPMNEPNELCSSRRGLREECDAITDEDIEDFIESVQKDIREHPFIPIDPNWQPTWVGTPPTDAEISDFVDAVLEMNGCRDGGQPDLFHD